MSSISWLNTFVMLGNTKVGPLIVAPSLSSSYLFELKFVDVFEGGGGKCHNSGVSEVH